MSKTGQIVFTTDLATEYGFHDVDGKLLYIEWALSVPNFMS